MPARSPLEYPERVTEQPPHGPAPARGSHAPRSPLTALPTSEVTLRPSLIEGLQAIAPKPQRSRVRYVIAVAVLGLLVWMAATPSIRGAIVARGRQLVSGRADAPQR